MNRVTGAVAALVVLVVGSGTVACSSTDAPDQRSSATVPATVAVPAGTAPPSTAAPVVTTTRVPVPGPTDPGSAGDPYFPLLGNGGYDVARYDLALRVDPRVDASISIRANITATATATLATFHLDLAGLTVRSVIVDGATAAFRRDGEELVVTPPQPIAAGSTFVTALDYAGVPEPVLDAEGTRLGWLRAGDTTYVVSEPNGAHGWLASNDHPTDKALFRFRIDVPEGITAAANGRLVSSTTENGRTVWEWQTAEPMATYLATIAIGSFTIVDGGTTKGVRIRHVLPTPLASQLSASIAGTPQMIDVLTSIFGPFPFSDYGVLAIDARLGFALETQTLSLFDRTILAGGNSAAIQVHELAHQWFGNSVSIRSWRDIWLTEGFATYTESLWRERTERGFDIDAAMRALARTNYAPIGDPGPANLFDRNVYNRGALTLHALRRTIGDDAFFAVLRSWASERAAGNGSTDDFIALTNRISGTSVEPFVRSWLDADPMPRLPG